MRTGEPPQKWHLTKPSLVALASVTSPIASGFHTNVLRWRPSPITGSVSLRQVGRGLPPAPLGDGGMFHNCCGGLRVAESDPSAPFEVGNER